jgi:hypothetical protein
VIDGEAIACDVNGLAVFDLLRYWRREDAGLERLPSQELNPRL